MADATGLPARIVRAIHFVPDGCWLWLRSTAPQGYGQVEWGGRNRRAHRVVYAILVGPIPDGHHLHHRCHVRACVNPDHLEPIEPGAHTRHHLSGRETCKFGHALTPENTYVRRDGNGRQCRKCKSDRQRQVYARYTPERKAATHATSAERRRQRWAASTTTCAVDGCERIVAFRGWCSAHYTRWQKRGDVLAHVPVR